MLLLVAEQPRHKSCGDQPHLQVLPQKFTGMFHARGRTCSLPPKILFFVLQWWYCELSPCFLLCRLWSYDLKLILSRSNRKHFRWKHFWRSHAFAVQFSETEATSFPWSIHRLILVIGTDVLREVWTELLYITWITFKPLKWLIWPARQ